MTVLVCQDCEQTIDYMPDEKVRVLYGKCSFCQEAAAQQSDR
ncbi:GapA-binding peptide SR1P [Effusibacillus consociatus]|uniref:GapA-binding peptide SR1P n=1 Tax=Effusibacillus consociatus TaxID=1117041 RepID=A0ABV9Q0J6_9BACL